MFIWIIFGVLSMLWMLDAYFTLSVLRKRPDAETNQLLKEVYRHSKTAFVLFKVIDLTFVVANLYLFSINYFVTAQTVAIIFIYIYAKVNWHNYKVWKKTHNKSKNSFSRK